MKTWLFLVIIALLLIGLVYFYFDRQLSDRNLIDIGASGIRCWYAALNPNGQEQDNLRQYNLGKAFANFKVLEKIGLVKFLSDREIEIKTDFLNKIFTPSSTPEMTESLILEIRKLFNFRNNESFTIISFVIN